MSTGKVSDPFNSLGKYHTHYREFDPIHNRWLSEDPAGYKDGLNLYAAYMGVNGTDPLGLAIYAFDGTDKTPEDNTNVWRFFNAYNQAYRGPGENRYFEGVGNYEGEPLGGLGGQGGRRILEEAYELLQRNFEAGDNEIVIIGFSRGAAMAREFANMIYYRGDPLGEQHSLSRGNTNNSGKMRASAGKANGNAPDIKFLGIWDTVGSFGVPGNKNDIGKDFAIPPNVKIARHAVAKHERRKNFELTSIYPYKGYTDPTGRLVEKWYPGCHSNVGGGYDDNYLQKAPLRDMAESAIYAGVKLHWKTLGIKGMQQSINGTGIHNSNAKFFFIPKYILGMKHPILTEKEVREIEKHERDVFYYNGPKTRIRR